MLLATLVAASAAVVYPGVPPHAVQR